jgi:hypothetical protein
MIRNIGLGKEYRVSLLCDVIIVVTLTDVVDVDPVWIGFSFSFWPSGNTAGS